jgi:outer membrane cobalamin receptor
MKQNITYKAFSVLLISFLIFTISLAFPLFMSQAFPQSNIKIQGYIYDQDTGNPVSGAEIKIVNTNYQTTSDNSGFFILEKLPVGTYMLEVNSLEFEKEIIPDVEVTEDVTRKINIYLKRKTYLLPPIESVADRIPPSPSIIEVIDREMIEKQNANTVSDILETVEGIFIQKTGTLAGRHEISIRGSSPEHVLVLIDGQKINPTSNSSVDLNSIPLDMVEKIEVYKGGASFKYGADALAGAVNIITHPQTTSDQTKAKAKNYLGSWESDIFNFSLKNPLVITNLTTNLACTYQTCKGDFEYDDPKNGKSKRENAYKRGYNFFMSGLYRFNPQTDLGFSTQWYRSKNGIPGATYQLTKSAQLNDSRRFLNLQFKKKLNQKISTSARLGFLRLLQHFKSDQDRVRYDTEYRDDILDVSLGLDFYLFPKNRLELGAEFQKDMLDHQDLLRPHLSMGKIKRQTKSFFLNQSQGFKLPGYLFLNNLNLNISFRYDDPGELEDFTSPHIGLTLSRGTKSKITLRGNYGKSYRQPSNNSLFWKEDVWSAGNPDLLPEKSENYDLGGEVGFAPLPGLNLKAGITYFHSFVWDIIIWRRRFDGRYMPVNISKAKIKGYENFIKFILFEDKIEINYQNTVTEALNRSGDRIYDGKFIPFRPRYVTNLEYKLTYSIFQFSHKLRWVSRRYTLEANTKKENPYHLEDLSLGLEKRFSRWSIKFDVQLKNLTNEEYILIQNHPMPGREWGVNLELIYGARNSR